MKSKEVHYAGLAGLDWDDAPAAKVTSRRVGTAFKNFILSPFDITIWVIKHTVQSLKKKETVS